MKAARIVVLAVAVVAGDAAALLASRPDAPAPAQQIVAPKVETTDVLVAKGDIATGSLSLALRSSADSNANISRIDDDATRRTHSDFNMVRYGVTIPTAPR